MILRYGSYAHANGEVDVSIMRNAISGEAGLKRGRKITWELNGRLEASTQANLTIAIAALEAAYAFDGRDAILYLSDGTTQSHHKLLNAGSKSGVRVTREPSYPVGQGAEYSTFRTYAITLEAEYESGDGTNQDNDEVSFVETIATIGTGGPAFVLRQGLRKVHKQRLFDATPVRVTQQGSSTGKTRYPLPPPPLFPADEHLEQRQITREAPKRNGNPGQPQYTDFTVSWQYTFEADSPLSNDPNRLPF